MTPREVYEASAEEEHGHGPSEDYSHHSYTREDIRRMLAECDDIHERMN